MKNQKLLKILGTAVVFLGSIIIFIAVFSFINTLKNNINNVEQKDTSVESRYISTDNTDQEDLTSNDNIPIEEQDEEIVPQKQGIIEADEERQILKFNKELSDKEIQDIEQKYDISFTNDDSNNGIYVVNVKDKNDITQLVSDQNVKAEMDEPVKISSDTIDWGISRIGADKIWGTSVGNSIKVAVIDTGIQLNHTDLQNNVITGYDFVNNDSDPNDDNGHGTHVAGIIAAVKNEAGTVGASYGAKLMPVKVLNNQGYGYISDVVKGIYYATDNGARIINMSFGSNTDSSILKDALTYAYNKGVLLVAAAGNQSGAPCNFPAAYSSVICVVAVDSNNKLATFSNLGGELAAPGVSNYSTYLGNTYKYLSGTSMASPHVAGAAAILMSACTTCSASEIRNILRETAIDLGNEGTDIIFGYGLVDLVSALNSLKGDTPENTTPISENNIPSQDANTTNTLPKNGIEQNIKITEPTNIIKNRYEPAEYGNIVIKFQLDPILEQTKVSKITLFLDNKPVYSTSKQSDEYEISTDLLDTSQHWLNITAYFNDGRQSHTKIIIDLTQFRSKGKASKPTNILGISSYFNLDWLLEK